MQPLLLKHSANDPHDETKNTHLFIVKTALTLLKREKNIDPRIKERLENKSLLTHLEQGLYDGDYLPCYNSCGTYLSHFYNPETQGTYLPTHPFNAKTEAARHFGYSKRYFQVKEFNKAFYQLGLSLHYFTDVTQPMHAKNYISNPNPLEKDFMYHTYFEEKATLKFQAPTRDMALASNGIYYDSRDPADHVREAAKRSRVLFDEIKNDHLIELHSKKKYDELKSKLKDPICKMLVDAKLVTAGFLYCWTQSLG